jgi:hypothetical protein
MIFRIIRRILRRHVLFHLLIPLIVGVLVEIIYSHFWEGTGWSDLYHHLSSDNRIALYVGIFLTYGVIMYFLLKDETSVGLRQIDLNTLRHRLADSTSLFAVGTMRFDEWFDPGVQVYLTTIYEHKISTNHFRYERVLLLSGRSAERDLRTDYIDGYHAKCLIALHRRLGISLYYLAWPQISAILRRLTPQERAEIGYYPNRLAKAWDWIAKALMLLIGRRRRVRKTAVGVINVPASGGVESISAFRFSKHDKIVHLNFESESRAKACGKFVALIKEELFQPGTALVKPEYNFIEYF